MIPPRKPDSGFRCISAEPRSTSCNGTNACGPVRHNAGSDETWPDATCSSGDAEPRRTSLAGMKLNRGERVIGHRPPTANLANRAGSRPTSVIDNDQLRPVARRRSIQGRLRFRLGSGGSCSRSRRLPMSWPGEELTRTPVASRSRVTPGDFDGAERWWETFPACWPERQGRETSAGWPSTGGSDWFRFFEVARS